MSPECPRLSDDRERSKVAKPSGAGSTMNLNLLIVPLDKIAARLGDGFAAPTRFPARRRLRWPLMPRAADRRWCSAPGALVARSTRSPAEASRRGDEASWASRTLPKNRTPSPPHEAAWIRSAPPWASSTGWHIALAQLQTVALPPRTRSHGIWQSFDRCGRSW